MASRRNRELQRYFDGELSPRRAAKVRRQLESSPEDQRRLDNLQSMRTLLQDASEEAVARASFDGVWSRVQVGITAAQPPTLGERVRLWFRSYGLMAASAAAAAVLALFLWLPEDPAHNDCDIESLDADPGAMSTIFTIDTPDNDSKTTVIWVNELGQTITDEEDVPTAPTESEGETP